MNTWLTADQHFRHENIIKYTNRPFKNVGEMDEALIHEWNSVVKPKDMVYHLGDFSLSDTYVARDLFMRLNGHIHVLRNRWHHDSRWLPFEDVLLCHENLLGTLKVISIIAPVHLIEGVAVNEEGFKVPAVLCHYPFLNWDRQHYGSFHFHAHSHGASPKRKNCLDVGVDNIYRLKGEYRPVTLEEACQMAEEQE